MSNQLDLSDERGGRDRTVTGTRERGLSFDSCPEALLEFRLQVL